MNQQSCDQKILTNESNIGPKTKAEGHSSVFPSEELIEKLYQISRRSMASLPGLSLWPEPWKSLHQERTKSLLRSEMELANLVLIMPARALQKASKMAELQLREVHRKDQVKAELRKVIENAV